MPKHLLLLSAALGIGGCSEPKAPWWDSLESGGSCHDVNLLDGLDTDSGDELLNTFYCLNQSGNLNAFVPTVESLREPSRDQQEGALHLALGFNALLQADLNVLSLAGSLLEWMETDSPLLEDSLKIVVELIYATPYSALEGADAPSLQSDLDNGALVPLLGGLREGLIAALDDNLAPLEMMDDALHSEKTLSLLHSLSALTQSKDEGFRHRMDDLLADFGAAIVDSQSPENNRTSSGSGNSLEDVARALILNKDDKSRSAIELAEEAAGSLFQDNNAQSRVIDALEGLQDRDALRTLPLQLRYLSDVPADVGSFGPGIDSALVSLLRLIHNANTSVECEVNWGFGSYKIELGNLSVALLEAFAELDPTLTTESVDILGDILDLPLTDTILNVIAALNVCPVMDEQFVDDLASIDRLNDSAAGDLLLVLVEVLKAIGEGSNSKIPEMVDLLSIPHAVDATIPLEELLRDLGGSAFLESLAAFAGPSLNPTEYLDPSTFPEGVEVLEFDDLWAIAAAAFEPQSNGKTALQQTLPLLEAIVADPNSWNGIHNLGSLLADARSETAALLDLMPTLLELDPELQLTRQISGIFFDVETAEHFAKVLEIPNLYAAVSASSEEGPGPLVFVAQLQLSGTLQRLLGTIDRAIGLLGLSTQ